MHTARQITPTFRVDWKYPKISINCPRIPIPRAYPKAIEKLVLHGGLPMIRTKVMSPRINGIPIANRNDKRYKRFCSVIVSIILIASTHSCARDVSIVTWFCRIVIIGT